MGEYANIKSTKLKRFLQYLERNKGIEFYEGGKHWAVKCIHNSGKFIVPLSHNEVNKYIIKAFVEWLVKNDICTKEEFNSKL